MPAQLADFVLETATAPGTGSFTLNGPEADRRSFSAAFPNGGQVFYFADDGSQAEWGIGTLTVGTPSTLSRTTVSGTTGSSKSVLNFPGTVEVYNELPAGFVLAREADGSVLVPAVTDWTKLQSVPASDADKRYIQRAVGSADYSPIQSGVSRSGKQIWINYRDDNGQQQTAYAQPAGDYATNSALNSTGSNLQSQVNDRVSRGGDEMRGGLTINSWDGLTAGAAPSSAPNGARINYPALNSVANGRGGHFLMQLKEDVGQRFLGTFALTSDGNSWRTLDMPQLLRLHDSQFGDVAYVNDLPLDPGKIILAWNGSVYGDARIPFPRGLSYVDTVLVVCSRQTDGNGASALINVLDWDNGSVHVNAVYMGGNTAGLCAVNYHAIVIGNK